jgi:alginate O-acetyltransferase complex protein AlgJ
MPRLAIVAFVLALPGWTTIVGANRALLARMEALERRLEQESVVGRALRPYAQWLLTGWLGAGNERVYPGRQGWLFYRADVEYVTGRGFLEHREILRRTAAAAEWEIAPQPDPLPAIRQFHADLAQRGIALLVMPTPVKPVVHPEALAGITNPPVRNASFERFLSALEDENVAVFDPMAALGGAGDKFLRTDTHWRPEAMEAVAERLARFIDARWPALSTVEGPAAGAAAEQRVERMEVRSTGDIVRMLDLPEEQDLYGAESVWLRRVVGRDGSTWRSTRGADVLVLGDSFSNIYSLESMGWGTSAGLVEHLSHALRRPIDRIVQNDNGSFATRALLAQDAARLEGTRVVVYQFAERELAFGDWKLLPLPEAANAR